MCTLTKETILKTLINEGWRLSIQREDDKTRPFTPKALALELTRTEEVHIVCTKTGTLPQWLVICNSSDEEEQIRDFSTGGRIEQFYQETIE